MQDPFVVSDSVGEWFELYNATTTELDLSGCVVRDEIFNLHTITSLVISAFDYVVLGRNASSTQNGGIIPDYIYSNFSLNNSADKVILECNNVEIDRVEYDGGPLFPDPTGASMILESPILDNNVGGNWCTSTSVFGDGDFGTPGALNDSCGDEPPAPFCGDGTVNQLSEECDGADGVSEHYICTPQCILEYVPFCGDNTQDAGEECDDGNNVDGDDCSAICEIEQGPPPETGEITVCKMIIDGDDNIVDGTTNPGTFVIPSGVSNQPLSTSTFSTPLTLNADILGDDQINDAQCIVYDGLDITTYYYGQEQITGDNWQEPLYNDQFEADVTSTDSFYSFDVNNDDSNGIINLVLKGPTRTLVVLNQFLTPDPVCGDGTIDDGEQCDDNNTDDGDGCSSTCQDETGPGPGPSSYQCSDGLDNDNDSLIDFTDPGCHTDGDVDNSNSYTPNKDNEFNGFNSCQEPVIPILDLENLQSVDIHEVTVFGEFNTQIFSTSSIDLINDIAQTSTTSDFSTDCEEFYDVFISNADGTANATGSYVSIEIFRDNFSVCTGANNVGNNIDAVGLTFGTSTATSTATTTVYADVVSSAVLGTRMSVGQTNSQGYADTAPGAPDVDYATNTVGFTRMGDEYSRLTLGFCEVTATTTATSTEPTGPVCGDGTTEEPEQCDDSNTDDGDGCSSICEYEDEPGPLGPVCGNSITEDPERCDDGNTDDGDGCSSTCQNESGGTSLPYNNPPLFQGVAGTSTTATSTATSTQDAGFCPYITEYLKIGEDNNPEQVALLQRFLRDFEGVSSLAVTGVFNQTTLDAVLAFQLKYKEDILDPWGIDFPTGFVFITTKNKINELVCGESSITPEEHAVLLAALVVLANLPELPQTIEEIEGTPGIGPGIGLGPWQVGTTSEELLGSILDQIDQGQGNEDDLGAIIEAVEKAIAALILLFD